MYDEDAMHKVIVNLIGNALKFTPKGGQITIYATPFRQEEQEKLFICIGIRGGVLDTKYSTGRIPLSTDKAGPESASIYANELSSCMEVQFVPRIIRAKDVLSVFYMPMQTVCPHQQSKLKNR